MQSRNYGEPDTLSPRFTAKRYNKTSYFTACHPCHGYSYITMDLQENCIYQITLRGTCRKKYFYLIIILWTYRRTIFIKSYYGGLTGTLRIRNHIKWVGEGGVGLQVIYIFQIILHWLYRKTTFAKLYYKGPIGNLHFLHCITVNLQEHYIYQIILRCIYRKTTFT